MFRSLTYGDITYEEILEKIIKTYTEKGCDILIGGDSMVRRHEVCYVQVIIVHMHYGGAYFFYNTEVEKQKRKGGRKVSVDIVGRLLTETYKTVELAAKVRDDLAERGIEDAIKEIHIDVGTEGKSKAIIAEVVGMVKAYDFHPVIKPEAYAASCVADRFSK